MPGPHLGSWLTLLLTAALCRLAALEPLPPCHPLLLGACGLTALSDDPAATGINPAAGEPGLAASSALTHGMRRLARYELASLVAWQYSSAYAAWQSLDNDACRRADVRAGVRYGCSFFRLGLGYKLLLDEIPGYGAARDDRLDAGLRLSYKGLSLDLGSEHRLPPRSGGEGSYNLCLGQAPDPNLTLAAGLAFAPDTDPCFKLGCRLRLYQNLTALAAWESEPARFGCAAAFDLGWLNLAYAVQTHPDLDWTHSLGLTVLFP